MSNSVESYIKKNAHWQQSLTELRGLLRETGLNEEIKWGAPAYTLEGKNVVGLLAFKSYVGLWFHQGVFLKDEHDLLEQSSESTRGLRKMMFYSTEDVSKNLNLIRDYIREAIQNQEEGKEIKVHRYANLQFPPELVTALEKDGSLKKAFNKFSQGKQREFADYIRTAKKATTKTRRMEKIAGLIRKGEGLNDRYK